jgi:hypothetical protein
MIEGGAFRVQVRDGNGRIVEDLGPMNGQGALEVRARKKRQYPSYAVTIEDDAEAMR